jgi:hypothetical protein
VYSSVSSITSKPTTTTTSISTTTSSNRVTVPGPTQSGIVPTCIKYAQPPAGTGCYDFAVANSITPAQLYAWNTILGVDGANCGILFFADDWYCVGVTG